MATVDDLAKKLDELQAEVKKKPGAVISWLVPVTISALVALVVGAIVNFLLSPKDHLEHIRAIAMTKGRIIAACNASATTPAIIFMRHELQPLYFAVNDVWSIWPKPALQDFAAFEATLTWCRQQGAEPIGGTPQTSGSIPAPSAELPATAYNVYETATAAPSGPTSPSAPTKEEIQEQFYSANRLVFSDELVRRSARDRERIASALIGAIVPAGERSYRINLYIALTLARFPEGWPGRADPGDELKKLTGPPHPYGDPTFKRRVDEAIANRKK